MVYSCSKSDTPDDVRPVQSLAQYTLIETPELSVTIDEQTYAVSAIEFDKALFALDVLYGADQRVKVFFNELLEPSGRVSGQLDGRAYDQTDFTVITTSIPAMEIPYTYTLTGNANGVSLTIVLSIVEESWGDTEFVVNSHQRPTNRVSS